METKCIINKSTMTDIADAIRAKGGASTTLLPSEMPSAIEAIPSGGEKSDIEEKDVNFYRPDGKLLYSYSSDEVLSDGWSMPEQPDWTVRGVQMVSVGWNCDIDYVRTYVADCGICDVGGVYEPEDGLTHVFLNITDDCNLYDQRLKFYNDNFSENVIIDWGDGSEPENIGPHTNGAAEIVHRYSTEGNYHVKIGPRQIKFVPIGSYNAYNFCGAPLSPSQSGSNRPRGNRVEGMILGNAPYIVQYAFSDMYNLRFVILPRSCRYVQGQFVQNCTSLNCIVFPKETTVQTEALIKSKVRTVSLPAKTGNVLEASCLKSCDTLVRLCIPRGGTKVESESLTMCYALRHVAIPNGVTSINRSAVSNCQSLSKIRFPSTIKTIESSSFSACYSVVLFDFSRSLSVPTLSNSNAFNLMNNEAKIVVPDSLYDQWIAATNWSSSKIVSHIVKSSEYFGG